jgi:hypothetical protein
MNYPYTAEPYQTFGFGTNVIYVCDAACADEVQAGIIDELTDGEIESLDEARCAACGRILVMAGGLTGAHYKDDEE